MKKILMGLLAISTASFAALDLANADANAAAGTNYFKTGQIGAMSVTGNIVSGVEPVTYVIYAEKDGEQSEVAQLSNFLLSTTDKTGFMDTNPTINVKKVVSGKLQPIAETVNFSVNSYGNEITEPAKLTYFTTGEKRYFNPFGMLSRAAREAMLKSLGDLDGAPAAMNKSNELWNGTAYYKFASKIVVSADGNGVLTFSTYATDWNDVPALSSGAIAKVDNYFATAKAIDAFKVFVKIG